MADVFAGAAAFCVPLAEVLAFDFDVSVTVSGAFFEVVIGEFVAVSGSGLATTLSTTVETLTRLMSLRTALVLGGKGAILRAVTGVFTVTCWITSASTPTDRRTTVDDVAVRDWLKTAIRSGVVVVVGRVVGRVLGGVDICMTGSVDGTAGLEDAGLEDGGLEGGWTAAGVFAAAKPVIDDEIVTDPMVLTVVVVRRGFEVLVAGGVVARGGVDAMTKDGTNGPTCVVDVDRRERT